MGIENKFSSALIKNFHRRGVWAHKHVDKFAAGIPDVYLCGSHWIECKATPIPRDSVNFMRLFSALQEQTLNTLHEGGDHTYVSIYVLPRREKPLRYFIFMPWNYFKYIERWNQQLLDLFAYPIHGIKNLPIDGFFDYSAKPIVWKKMEFMHKWQAFEKLNHRYHIRHDRTVGPFDLDRTKKESEDEENEAASGDGQAEEFEREDAES